MKMFCIIHGEFWKSPGDHKSGHGCPNCTCESRGEIKIICYLKNNDIRFIQQKKFNNCIYKGKLKFDFYIPSLNMCVEYDGIQHFQFTPRFHETEQDFKEQQFRDKIKTDYCTKNNIKLIRIPYTEFDNIETILENYFRYQYRAVN